MTRSLPLLENTDLLSPEKVLETAAALHGLEIKSSEFPRYQALSKPIASFELSGFFLEELKTRGFQLVERTDARNLMTLSPNNIDMYWNFRGSGPHSLELRVLLTIKERERGITLTPYIRGGRPSGIVFGSSMRANVDSGFDSVVKSMAEVSTLDIHPLVKRFAEDNYHISCLWQDMDLGGIRTIKELFAEWSGSTKSDARGRLARAYISPFSPSPGERDTEELFVPEFLHPALFQQWQSQLNRFKEAL